MPRLRGPFGRMRFVGATATPDPPPAEPEPPAGGDIFTANFAAAAYPNCGFDVAWTTSANWTRSHRVGAGPSGQSAVELQQLSNPGAQFYGGQYGWGWEVAIAAPGWGVPRYFRWRIKFDAACDFDALSWADGTAAVSTNKLFILANAGVNRIIMETRHQTTGDRLWGFQLRENSQDPAPETGRIYSIGEWHSIQIGVKSSSSSGVADGWIRAWVDNAVFDAPVISTVNYPLNPVDSGRVSFGRFQNMGLSATGVHTFQVCDFQIGSAFDSTWHTGA